MKGKILLIYILSLLSCCSCFCQFNDSISYQTRYSGTGMLNNTPEGDSYVASSELKFAVNKKRTAFTSLVKHVYGEQQRKKTNNDLTSALDYEFRKNTHKIFYWARGTFDKSYSLSIHNRAQTGLGVGWNILKNEKFNIILTEGFLYEYVHLNEKQPDRLTRNSVRLKYRLTASSRLSIEGFSQVQNSLENREDYIIRSQNMLILKLNKALNLTGGVEFNQLNINSKENLMITFGMVFDRFF